MAPSICYAARPHAPPWARAVRDEQLNPIIQRSSRKILAVYGVREVYKQLRREGHQVPRCQVERLVRELCLFGEVRGNVKRTTIPATERRPEDLVQRQFQAPAPNRLWVTEKPPRRRSAWCPARRRPDAAAPSCPHWRSRTAPRGVAGDKPAGQRRAWDSNPRNESPRSAVFKTAAIGL